MSQAKYKDENGKDITEKVFIRGKADRATAQAVEARRELESSNLDEVDFLEAEERVEGLEKHAAFYNERDLKLNGARTADKPVKKKGESK